MGSGGERDDYGWGRCEEEGYECEKGYKCEEGVVCREEERKSKETNLINNYKRKGLVEVKKSWPAVMRRVMADSLDLYLVVVDEATA
ncbi:hypothetical protein Pmani_035505 [Petrolisthes manimaculis]|uniref:Uncharacterized protein n=1 Tax=Petrolisthes manimaculis TaxID=1843537 RepID=A0AAE1NKE8_9EUCA|nr:hypothetical protein Pmani_035505 [Petrolisthes manimaculis]